MIRRDCSSFNPSAGERLSRNPDLAMTAHVDQIVKQRFTLNTFSFLTIYRSRKGGLISIFELIYGNSPYNKKLIIETLDVLRIICELKKYKTIFYPSCEIIIREDKDSLTKLVFHPSTYEVNGRSVTFGVWHKRNNDLTPSYTFTLYNEYEIRNFLGKEQEIHAAYVRQIELNQFFEIGYERLFKILNCTEIVEEEEILKALNDVEEETFKSSLADKEYPEGVLNYIKIKGSEEFLKFVRVRQDAYRRVQDNK